MRAFLSGLHHGHAEQYRRMRTLDSQWFWDHTETAGCYPFDQSGKQAGLAGRFKARHQRRLAETAVSQTPAFSPSLAFARAGAAIVPGERLNEK